MNDQEIFSSETITIVKAIIKGFPFGILVVDNNERIILINDKAKKILDLTINLNRKNMVLSDFFTPDEILAKSIRNTLSTKKKVIRYEAYKHRQKYLSIKGNLIPNGLVIIFEDVTRKKKSELGALKAVLRAQEEERQRIGRELHDGFGPMLSAVKLHLGAIREDLNDLKPETLAELDSTFQLVDNAANEMRNLSHDLIPGILQDFGIREALENIIKSFRNKHCSIEFNQNIEYERFSKNIEMNLFRISQELLQNAIKHSQATKIYIQLLKHSDSLVLMVEDNGTGFDTGNTKFSGNGLKNIELRAKAIDADFYIDSAPNAGVTATIEVGLNPAHKIDLNDTDY